CQRGFRDSLFPPVAVDEEARDPPVGRSRTQLAEPSHSARELGRGSELTPPNDVRAVVDEGRVGLVCSNKSLLVRPVRPGLAVRFTGLEVEGDAPAATPYAIVLLHNSHEVRPCPFAEFLGQKSRHGQAAILPSVLGVIN